MLGAEAEIPICGSFAAGAELMYTYDHSNFSGFTDGS